MPYCFDQMPHAAIFLQLFFSLYILVWLLLEGGYYFKCGYYSSMAFISLGTPDCAATIRGQLLFEGGV